MRTAEEVDFEIHRLRGLTVAKGPHQRNVHASIVEAIEELKIGVDSTCGEFHDQPDIVKDAVMQARAWKEGSTTIRPSEGYGQLAVTGT